MSFASRIRRAVLGPTDEEISAKSRAPGGPTEDRSTRESWIIYDPIRTGSRLPQRDVSSPSSDEWMPDTATDLPAVREEAMTQPQAEEPIDFRSAVPVAGLNERYAEKLGAPYAEPSVDEFGPMVSTLGGGGEAADPDRETCPHCRGTGHVLTIRDYLDEIVAMLPEGSEDKDAMIAEFYQRLLANYPHLAFLFPTDLTTGDALNSKGHRQRDQLWNGLEALLTRYDPDRRDSENMRALVTALESFGRDHSAFRREDGSVEGATEDEYVAVRHVLLWLCQDAFQETWEPAHTYALMRAYRFAMVKMMNAAEDNPMTAFAREPRR